MNIITKSTFGNVYELPISISATGDGRFVASCLYSEDVRVLRTPEEKRAFVPHKKEITADSADSARQQLIAFLEDLFADL